MSLRAVYAAVNVRSYQQHLEISARGFKLDGSTLKLSKIGELKLRLHRPVEGRVKTLTISRSPSGKWYAVFACVVESKPIEGRLPAVGVDLGLNSLGGPIRWNIN